MIASSAAHRGRATPVPPEELAEPGLRLADLLALTRTGRDELTSEVVYGSPWPVYGGQVAAQALIAAGATVPAGRSPHSTHMSFLELGSSAAPVDFEVSRDRDGGSFSARRVAARQGGRLLLTMSVSFAAPETEPQDELQVVRMPATPAPADVHAPPRLVEFERSVPPQGHALEGMPTRFWARCTATLPDDPVMSTAVLLYLSDLGTGHDALPGSTRRLQPSMDHALWVHRPVRVSDWLLVDFATSTVGSGRGHYVGTIWRPDGTLVASLAQETLYRRPRAARSQRDGQPRLLDMPLADPPT